MKFLTWQNPEQLFVAQELINKVKSKCCGIKDEINIIYDSTKRLYNSPKRKDESLYDNSPVILLSAL